MTGIASSEMPNTDFFHARGQTLISCAVISARLEAQVLN